MRKIVNKIKRDKRTVVPKTKRIPEKLFQSIQKSIPVPCVDLLPIRKTNQSSTEVLLVKRRIYPEEGKWVGIGGRIIKGESLKNAVSRQAGTELGVRVKILPPFTYVNPFGVFSEPTVDKQKHAISLTYLVSISKGKVNQSGPEFSEAKWFSLDKLPTPIGFHFRKVLNLVKKYSKKSL